MAKRLLCVAVVLAFVFAASMAFAYPIVSLKYAGVQNNTDTSIWAVGIGNVTTETGNYILSIENPPGSTAFTVSGYCVEPEYSSSSYLQYELVPVSAVTIGNPQAYEAAAWILSQGYTGASAAAAQTAVWELTWDYGQGNPYSLTEGNFHYRSGLSGTQLALVPDMYDAALDAVLNQGFTGSGYVVAMNPLDETSWSGAQDYIIPNPVPIPGSMLLMGTGLLGLGFLGRRKRFQA